MNETNNRIEVRLPENYAGGTVEVVLREGQAIRQLDPKAPVKTKLSGVIGVPVEYLKKRVKTGQFTQERSCLTVNREEILLSLIINEDDEYLRGQIDGKLDFHPKFIEFGINTGKIWTPTDLGLFFKMNRAFFPDKSVNMKLVTDLMNFTAVVNSKIEKSARESGDRTDNFSQMVNSNLPESFVLNIPIFKGMESETLEVETFAKIDGRAVAFTLFSPGASQTLEEIRDKAIDAQLEQIREIAPNIAIIEV
jgi:hypothetical protein